MKTVPHVQNRPPLRNNAKKLREKEKEWEKVARCILVHYSNCPTGTQQCVAMHCHCCSKVFKKRDPAINPMNMGFLGPLRERAARTYPKHECMCIEQYRHCTFFASFPRADDETCVSFLSTEWQDFKPLVGHAVTRIYACSIILLWNISFEVNKKYISRQHIFRSLE